MAKHKTQEQVDKEFAAHYAEEAARQDRLAKLAEQKGYTVDTQGGDPDDDDDDDDDDGTDLHDDVDLEREG